MEIADCRFVCVLPVVCAVSCDALGQSQRAAKEHDVSVARESAEVAEEPETHTLAFSHRREPS